MRRNLIWLGVLGLVITSAEPARANFIFTATLTGAQENPPNSSTAFGSAVLVLNTAQTQLTLTVTINGLDFTGLQTPGITADNLTAAHIHAGATSGQPGTNAGVVWGFFGTPFNDNAPNDQVVTPFATGVGGTISGKWDALEGNGTTLTAQIPNILAGRSYLNFHTTGFPGGEIRGQILPVPEPASLTLVGVMAAVGGLVARRRRRSI